MKDFLLIITVVLLICTWGLAGKVISTYKEIKTDYCSLFSKYDEYFTMLDNPYNMIDRTEEYSRYFYFKDEFLKYCK